MMTLAEVRPATEIFLDACETTGRASAHRPARPARPALRSGDLSLKSRRGQRRCGWCPPLRSSTARTRSRRATSASTHCDPMNDASPAPITLRPLQRMGPLCSECSASITWHLSISHLTRRMPEPLSQQLPLPGDAEQPGFEGGQDLLPIPLSSGVVATLPPHRMAAGRIP
jgi:hypothetical protein